MSQKPGLDSDIAGIGALGAEDGFDVLEDGDEALVLAGETEETRAGATGAGLEGAGEGVVRAEEGGAVGEVVEMRPSSVRTAGGCGGET